LLENAAGFQLIHGRFDVRWSYCNFLDRLSIQRIEEDYAGLF
jgi:hypothetical protein